MEQYIYQNQREVDLIRADVDREALRNITEKHYQAVDKLITELKEKGLYHLTEVLHLPPFIIKGTPHKPAYGINLKRD